MAFIDRTQPNLLDNQTEEQQIKYRFTIIKSLETFERAVAVACNKHDAEALHAIQDEVATILRTAFESIAVGLPYARCE